MPPPTECSDQRIKNIVPIVDSLQEHKMVQRQPTNQQWGIIKVRAIAEEAQFIIIVFRLFNGIEKFLTLSGCTTKAI